MARKNKANPTSDCNANEDTVMAAITVNTNNKPLCAPTYVPDIGQIVIFPDAYTEAERQRAIEAIVLNMPRIFQLLGNNAGVYNIDIGLLSVDMNYQRDPLDTVRDLEQKWVDKRVGVLTLSIRDGKIYVVDGFHRVIAAAHLGIRYLPAIIYTDLTLEDEIQMFYQQQDANRKLLPFDKYKAKLMLKEKVATTVKRQCDEHDIPVMKGRYKAGVLTSVDTAETAVKSIGENGWAWILDMITNAGWKEYKNGLANYYLSALKYTYKNLYNPNEPAAMQIYTDNILSVMRNCSTDDFDEHMHRMLPQFENRKGLKKFFMRIAKGEFTYTDMEARKMANTVRA